MPLTIPAFLNEGDTIGIFAPARFAYEEQLNETKNIIEQAGFSVKMGSNIGLRNQQFAGTDKERANALMELTQDPQVKAIIAARGGYGTARILEHLDLQILKENPKWWIGFSDVTVLHLLSRWGLQQASIHGPVATTLQGNSNLFELLQGSEDWSFEASRIIHDETKFPIEPLPITGGNISVIQSLLGSASTRWNEPHILFLEDLDEMLYHLDRMLLGMEKSELFKHTLLHSHSPARSESVNCPR
ncbi:MAG: LD-carboxypeptidase [Bacteroidota bacterium]